MKYWEGIMNWPIDKGWLCETCGSSAVLVWGLVNGQCRCSKCHTQYSMRVDDKILSTPYNMLKKKYKAAAKTGYAKYRKPISKFVDEEWAALLAEVDP